MCTRTSCPITIFHGLPVRHTRLHRAMADPTATRSALMGSTPGTLAAMVGPFIRQGLVQLLASRTATERVDAIAPMQTWLTMSLYVVLKPTGQTTTRSIYT